MKTLQTVQNDALSLSVNVYGDNENPMFNAGEVALLLWSPSKVRGDTRYADMNKLRKALGDSESAVTPKTFITERQYYKAILKSNSPVAEPLYDWLSEEVLPALREKGFVGANKEMTEAIDDVFGKRIKTIKDMLSKGRKYGYQYKKLLIEDLKWDVKEWLGYIKTTYAMVKSDERPRFLTNIYRLTVELKDEYRKTSTDFNAHTYSDFESTLHYLKKEESAFKGRSAGKKKATKSLPTLQEEPILTDELYAPLTEDIHNFQFELDDILLEIDINYVPRFNNNSFKLREYGKDDEITMNEESVWFKLEPFTITKSISTETAFYEVRIDKHQSLASTYIINVIRFKK